MTIITTKARKVFIPTLVSFFVLLMFLLPAATSFAHASLIQSTPEPNSQLDKAPSKIQLTFNERLQKELYWIKVFDTQGHKVTNQKAKMSTDQKRVYLKSPNLDDGTYTVSYHIISADGHPIEASYLFTIGKTPVSDAVQTDTGHHHGSLSFYLLRGLYYFLLLTLSGWILWSNLTRGKPIPVKSVETYWFKYFKMLFALGAIGMAIVQLIDAVSGFDIGSIGKTLFSSQFGLSITILFFLGITVFALRKSIWFDNLWVILALVAEGFSGHALAVQPAVYTVILDIIHLFTAAIWVGGLLIIITHWTSSREKLQQFLPVFSKGAMFSLIILVITGTLQTLAFLPDLADLFRTVWGILLLIKIALVVVVFVTGALLQRAMKNRSQQNFSKRFKVDFTLMVVIVAIVGALTYSSPLPSNDPLNWKVTQNHLTIETVVTPKNPGVENIFTVKVMTKTKPQYVKVNLTNLDNTSISHLEVPLKLKQGKSGSYTYKATGPFFSLPGKWQIEIRVLDKNDNETVFHKKTELYQVTQ